MNLRSGRWIGPALGMLAGVLSSQVAAGPQRADVESNHAATPELALRPEAEKRAQAHAHYVTARMLEDAGRMREALGHYLAFLESDGGDPELAGHIAELALNYQGMEAAVKLLEDALKGNPSSPQPYINLTRFALTHASTENGLKQRATEAAQEAVTRFPQSADAYENAARLQLSQNARGQAMQTLEQAAKQNVADAAFWLQLGRVAQDVWPLADSENREAHLAHVNVFFDKAMLRAREAGDETSEMWIADFFLFSNQLDRAVLICEWVAQRNGSLDARKRLVRLYEATERPEDSLKALEGLVKAYPQDVEHRKLLAAVYDQRRRTAIGDDRTEYAKKSAEQYEAALQAGGGDLSDYVQTVELIQLTGDDEKLERFTARAQQLFPGEPTLGFYRGVALNGIKKYNEAAKMMEETAKLAETRAPELLKSSQYHRVWGEALERSGQFDAAAKAFEKSVDLTPTDNPPSAASTMNYWGYMWVEQDKNLDKAEQLIRKANELRPDEPAFIDSLGWLFFKQGKYPEALAELERAEKHMEEWTPADAEILDHIAQTHEKLGNMPKAKEYWTRALELEPPQEEIWKRAARALGLEKPKPPQTTPPEEEKEKAPAPGAAGAVVK